MPEISVLMPVYNSAATLHAAVRSIAAQSHTDWELVAVDDGSTDESGRLLAEWGSKDSRLQLSRKPHGGIVETLNHGLAIARGRLIARMDADDIAAPERLGKQHAFLNQHSGIGLVGSQVNFGGDRVASAGYALHVEWINRLIDPEQISFHRFVEAPVAHPSVMFRADLLPQFGGYREGGFPEDYELWLRWMDAGVRFGKVPDPLLTWNDPPERLSRRHQRYSVASFYRVKARYLARWLSRHNPHHPRVVVIGSGRVTRRRVEMLAEHGVEVTAYVDIDPKKVGRNHGGAPVLAVEDLPAAGKHFVLAYVGKRGARDLIDGWLRERGYVLGSDWLPAA